MLTDNSSATVVLIVEDDSSHIALLSRSFASCPEGFRLHLARSLRVARQIMNSHSPNLVLASDCLPDGRGTDLVAEAAATCPVILMTADDIEQLAVETMQSRALDYVVKSSRAFAEMPSTVRQALRDWTLLQDPECAKELLDRQELRGRVMMDNSPDPIARYDQGGRCLYVNSAFEELIGLPASRLLGKTLDEIPAAVAAAMAKPVQQAIGRVLNKGVSTEVELSWRNRTGSNRCYRVRLVPRFDGKRLESLLSVIRDIGDLQGPKVELQAQLNFLSQLLECIPLPIFYKDIDGVYRGCNEAFATLVGQSKDQILGRTVFDLVPKAQADIYHEADAVLFRQGGQQFYETSVIDHDGVRHEVILHKSIYADANGCAAGIVGAMLDITDSKHYQEALAVSERKFRTLVENTPDTIARYDRECRRIYANSTFVQLADLPVEELLGKTPTDYTHSPGAVEYENRIRQAFQSGTIDEFEFTWPDRDGKEITSLIRLVPERNEEGRIESVLCVGRDITERKRVEEALTASQRHLRSVTQTIPDMIWMKNVEGEFLFCNHAVERITGKAESEIVGATDYELWDPDLAAFVRQKDLEAMEVGRISINEEWVPSAESGQQILLETRKVPVFDPDGKATGILGIARDITEQRRATDLLYQREQEFRAMIEHSPDPFARYDREGRRIYVNPALEKAIGQSAHLLLGKTPSETPVGGNAELGRQVQRTLERVRDEGAPAELELCWNDEDGLEHCYQIRFVPEFDQGGGVTSVLSTGRDISSLRAHQCQLHDLAYYDLLTGLPNRRLFLDRLQQTIADQALRAQEMLGLMLLDLDRFKAVNDSFGHSAGDSLLRLVGERLSQNVRDCDIVARLGGDEFAILLPKVPSKETLEAIVLELQRGFTEPFDIDGRLLNVTASIGIACCPGDAEEASELLQLADTAMYHVRSMGRNRFLFASAELTVSAKEQLVLETELGHALQRQEFELYYQPKMEMASGRLVGAEALLRWQHPELGMVAPDLFVGLAEETGLIVALGEWVLRSACSTACAWNRSENVPLKVAVNLSARQFDQHNLVETVASILTETGCRPQWLELEITESLMLEEREDILNALEELHRMGCSIAMDDFGTGYSALGYLAKFPINILKIDRSFVGDLCTNRFNAELIKAMASLARALDIEMVAEGVETCEQAYLLMSLGCCFAQGYLFGKPVSREQFEKMMGNRNDQWNNRLLSDIALEHR